MKLNRETIFNFISSNLNYFNKWREDRKEYNHLKNLLKNAKREKLFNKKIVFNTARSLRVVLDRELFIGKLLALNGAKIVILLDDGILKQWDNIFFENLPNIYNLEKFNLNLYPRFTFNHLYTVNYKNLYYKNYGNFLSTIFKKNIIKKALKTYKDQNIKIIYYSNIINNVHYENWQELKKFAQSSTIRFFKNSVLDYNNKNVKYYYNLSLKNAILSRNIGEYILNKIKPDFYITSHGIYSIWGPAFEFLKKNGINCLVYMGIHGHAINQNQITFLDTKIQFLSSSKFWKKYKETPVTEKMKKTIEKYFDQRYSFTLPDTKILYEGKKSILKIDKNDGYKYHIAMFPHVIYDGNIRDRHIAFDNYLDWLISTINYLKNRKDVKLYIRGHPAEAVYKIKHKTLNLIKKFVNLENVENIVLIHSEKKINTYEFLKSGIDLALVYDGFLGIEIPYLKIPIITCVKGGVFSVDEGNFTITNKKEYFNYLDNIEGLIEEFQNNYYNKYYNNIVRYAYWYLYEVPIKLPTLNVLSNYLYGTDLSQLKKKDLILDKKYLDLFS